MRVALAAGAVVVGQMADAATCAVMVLRHGATAEANPLARALITSGGLESLFLVKIALAALVISAIASVAVHAAPRVGVALAATGLIAGLFGACTNVLTW